MPLASCTIQEGRGEMLDPIGPTSHIIRVGAYGRGVEAVQAQCARHQGEILENP